MTFHSPWVLFFLPAVLFAVIIQAFRARPAAFRFSSGDLVAGLRPTWRVRLARLPFVLRLVTITLFMIALAGPRLPLSDDPHAGEGINIVLLTDLSTSMAAEDFTLNGKRTNRVDVIKSVIRDFIHARPADRIGLIAFAARPYLVCPPTADHAWLEARMEQLRFGLIEDGTAIGSAIASAVNRLKGMEGRSKVAILLTDGVNNAGSIDPLTAAKAAAAKGVRVYTIGTGSRGPVPYPVTDLFGRTVYQNISIDLDEDELRAIARIAGGMYFRATDTESLKKIYGEIDRMEKVRFEDPGYRSYEELFDKVLILALLLLVLEGLLSRTVFLKIP